MLTDSWTKCRWETFAEAIIPAANLQPGSAPRIWLGGFSSSSTASSGAFSAQNLFAQGVLTGPYGDYVDTYVVTTPLKPLKELC